MSDEVTQEALTEVFSGILRSAEEELRQMKQEDLEKYYFFKFDYTQSKASNLYRFQDLLGLYGRKCRRWEEIHNGSCCVVGRVRDTYLMPKIHKFIEDMDNFVEWDNATF